MPQTIYFNSKQATRFPLQSNSPSFLYTFLSFLPRFYALLKGFFWDALQCHRYGPLDGLSVFKIGSLLWSPWVLEKEKVTRSKATWWIRRWFGCGDVPIGKEQPNALLTQFHRFSDKTKSSVIIFRPFSCSTDLWPFDRSTNDRHAQPALRARRWPQFLLKASYSWNHLSPPHDPLWITCVNQKYVGSTCLFSSFSYKCSWRKFSQSDKKFRLVRSSLLITERPPKRCKHVKNNATVVES